jgi:signal transduction histidine kinase
VQGTESNGPSVKASAVPAPAATNSRFADISGFVNTVGIGNLLLAIVFGIAAVVLVNDPANGGGVAAAVLAQALTLPILLAKVAPALAAGALTAGVLLNEILIGPMIRCGVVFPVMLVIVYQLGATDSGKHRSLKWLGLAACIATTAMELAWDPALDASSGLFIASLGLGFYYAGVLIRSRTRLVAALQSRTNELQRQRERTAAMEVAADRVRVGADLENLIRQQIREIGVNAERAKAAVNQPGQDIDANAALTDVEESGRDTLARMRELVGNLREAPTDPTPGLDQLSALTHRATGADVRLTVKGNLRPLRTNLQLSAYRIVEQLLTTLNNHPGARVEVVIQLTAEELEIRVSGPATDGTASGADETHDAMHAVRARADLHGGSVRTSSPSGRRETEVRLPLLTSAPR